jgi:uncharacterized protein YceH (UPF0502 family)
MANREAEILSAISRLFANSPARGSGDLTVVNLAREAGLSRNELYRTYRPLVDEFLEQARAQSQTRPKANEADLAGTELRVKRLTQEVAALRKERNSLASVVVALDGEVEELRRALESAHGVSRIADRQ